MAAWRPHQCTRAWSHRLKRTRMQYSAVVCLSETSERRQWAKTASDWKVVSNQQSSFIDLTIHHYSEIILMRVAKPKANTEHLLRYFSVTVMTIRYCCYEQIDLCFVSQGKSENSRQQRWAVLLQIYFSICVPKLSKFIAIWQSYCKNKKNAIFASQCTWCFKKTAFSFSGWIGLLKTWQGEKDRYLWKN